MSDKNAVITCIVIHIHTYTHIYARVHVVKKAKNENDDTRLTTIRSTTMKTRYLRTLV